MSKQVTSRSRGGTTPGTAEAQRRGGGAPGTAKAQQRDGAPRRRRTAAAGGPVQGVAPDGTCVADPPASTASGDATTATDAGDREPRPRLAASGASDARDPRAGHRWTEQNCRLTYDEYDALTALKRRASDLARPMKRGELLRLGLQQLAQMSDEALFRALDGADLPRR